MHEQLKRNEYVSVCLLSRFFTLLAGMILLNLAVGVVIGSLFEARQTSTVII